jgi:hypothetical protein
VGGAGGGEREGVGGGVQGGGGEGEGGGGRTNGARGGRGERRGGDLGLGDFAEPGAWEQRVDHRLVVIGDHVDDAYPASSYLFDAHTSAVSWVVKSVEPSGGGWVPHVLQGSLHIIYVLVA